jgi:preprotein translocase subunit SecY
MTYPRFFNKIITAGVPSGIFKPFLTISNEQIIKVLRQFSRIAIMAYLMFVVDMLETLAKLFFSVVCAVPVDQSLIFCLVCFVFFFSSFWSSLHCLSVFKLWL